jgi:hypothetical protein
MFCTVKLNSNLDIGTVVQFNTTDQNWTTATNHQDTIGVISQAPVQDEETMIWWAKVIFAGTAFALADRAIPDQGGKLNVNNGKVFVDNSSNANGIVAPLTRGETTRAADSLVLVDIR